MLVTWLQFVACASVIWFAGMRVSKYGNLIADKTGASRTWIGVVLMASVTSLPELFTGISSSTIAQTPDIAIGDVLGSCVFNLLILVIVDVMHGRTPVFTGASRGHVLTAGYNVMLIGLVAAGLILHSLGLAPRFGHVGAVSVVIIVLYATAMRGVFHYELQRIAEHAEALGESESPLTLRQVVTRYAAWAAVVVAAATWLPFSGERLATVMGWGHSFVGSLFIAFATSLPEVVVTFGCVRQGAIDLAIGNVLGSNLFNILILAIDDLLYVRGPLLGSVQPVHLFTAITAMMMTGLAVVGLLYHPRSRPLRVVGWVGAGLVVLYVLNAIVLYAHRR